MANNHIFFDFGGVIASEKNDIVGGMDNLIRKLKLKYDLSIISSADTSKIRRFLKNYNLLNCFQSILGYDPDKNKTEKIKWLLHENEINTLNCLMVTDTCDDIFRAKEAGIKTIGVAWGIESALNLQKADPLMIAKTPMDLGMMIDNYLIKEDN